MTTWQEFIIGAFFPLFAGALCMVAYGLGMTCPRWISRLMANRARHRSWQLEHARRRQAEVTRQLENQRAFYGERDALVRALASESTWLERFML